MPGVHKAFCGKNGLEEWHPRQEIAKLVGYFMCQHAQSFCAGIASIGEGMAFLSMQDNAAGKGCRPMNTTVPPLKKVV